MSNSWGKSWLTSWLVSWAGGTAPPTPVDTTVYGGGIPAEYEAALKKQADKDRLEIQAELTQREVSLKAERLRALQTGLEAFKKNASKKAEENLVLKTEQEKMRERIKSEGIALLILMSEPFA